ncbi:hypothetical protein PGB34_17155 [Xenophilus arseniciresistens]|uniref:Uncharacterized protein n=1 Tax=Xenophilus arseniciresistens TaxID=1283306 RepID=A0AAE3NAJ8_9BURK|nr:hypothetical protein [Xenophilus arseniciresistens]MDA7418096.1 hypothetical protein [Xenophilus arseniciresistens]
MSVRISIRPTHKDLRCAERAVGQKDLIEEAVLRMDEQAIDLPMVLLPRRSAMSATSATTG